MQGTENITHADIGLKIYPRFIRHAFNFLVQHIYGFNLDYEMEVDQLFEILNLSEMWVVQIFIFKAHFLDKEDVLIIPSLGMM